MPTRFVLIRHGQSEMNVVIHDYLLQGKQAPAWFVETIDREFRLSDTGRDQAKLAAANLKKLNLIPDAIYVSDFIRAQETCAIVYEEMKLNIPIKISVNLNERSWGHTSSLPAEEQAKIRESNRHDLVGYTMPGGESFLEVRLRAQQLIMHLKQRHPDKVIFMFAHHEFIEAFWAEIADMTTESHLEFFKDTKIENCTIIEFDYSANKKIYRMTKIDGHTTGWKSQPTNNFSLEEILDNIQKYETYLTRPEETVHVQKITPMSDVLALSETLIQQMQKQKPAPIEIEEQQEPYVKREQVETPTADVYNKEDVPTTPTQPVKHIGRV